MAAGSFYSIVIRQNDGGNGRAARAFVTMILAAAQGTAVRRNS